jgi:2-methylisocitrate lyase-like PEP mutase family enzyme
LSRQLNFVSKLRKLINRTDIVVMPCCYDALSAKRIQAKGFPLTFMSGFAVSASRLGMPDTGLISYTEMVDQGQNICSAVDIPVIGDGDTGYGNVMNVKRTVHGYIKAGFSGIMIEDQVSPKRCGHTKGKAVVQREQAVQRISAVMEAREEARVNGEDILIVGRTDARATLGLTEAIERAKIFHDMGADIIFVEAPHSKEEMVTICQEVGGNQMANMVEHGVTPVLKPEELQQIGFRIVAYPLTLISAATHAMDAALESLKAGNSPQNMIDFSTLQEIAGFPQYDIEMRRLEGELE